VGNPIIELQSRLEKGPRLPIYVGGFATCKCCRDKFILSENDRVDLAGLYSRRAQKVSALRDGEEVVLACSSCGSPLGVFLFRKGS